MYLSKRFNTDLMYSIDTILTKQILSSTERLQDFISRRLGISDLSDSLLNMSTNKGARGDPIATPSTWM